MSTSVVCELVDYVTCNTRGCGTLLVLDLRPEAPLLPASCPRCHRSLGGVRSG